MAEIRKYDPASGEGIQRQVRDLLGENIRPIPPGEIPQTMTEEPVSEPEFDAGISIDYVWEG